IPTAGLVLLLESDLNVTTNGAAVGGWLDQSGWGNDLSAAGNPTLVPDATPSGQPAIAFDGSGDKLERTATLNAFPAGSADRSMFVVTRYDGGSAWGGIAYGQGSNNKAFGLGVVTSGSTSGKLMVQ